MKLILKWVIPAILAVVVCFFTYTAILNTPIAEEAIVRTNESITQALSLELVKLHASQKDCWTIINNSVYDITDYLPVHPGGPVIAEACGKDGTELFATKGVNGRDHSDFAKSLLKKYLIGAIGEKSPFQETNQTSQALPDKLVAALKLLDNPIIKSYRYVAEKNGFTYTLVVESNGKLYTMILKDGELTISEGDISGQLSASNVTKPVLPESILDLSEVSKHNTKSDCWLIISGNVYDVTDYIPLHPGGVSMITNSCGKEATAAFGDKGGTGGTHSSFAKGLLKNYLLGSLVNAESLPPVATITSPANGAQFEAGTTSVSLRVSTDKSANCRWDSSDKAYSSMKNSFSTTGGKSHSATITGLADGVSYNRYVRCSDADGIAMTSSVKVTFSVKTIVVAELTLAELALHNTQSDCWLLISGKIYDVTPYIPIHPGGVSMITNNCGRESTNAFNSRGGSGTHSTNARNLLNNYYLADLTVTPPSNATNTTTNTTLPGSYTVAVTSSGALTPSSLTVAAGSTITFSYTNPGDEIILTFSPSPPSSMKLDHEHTQGSYTFMSAGTYTFGKSGGTQGTIIVQ